MGLSKTAAASLAAAGAAAFVLLRRRAQSFDFADKVVVVTGGSRGLGFALARSLVRAGALVTIFARDEDELARARELLLAEGRVVDVVVCDVRAREQVDEAIERVVARYGRLDVLINNAGVIEVAPFLDLTLDDFREAMETHFWGPLYTSLAALPHMRAQKAGRIVNVSSIGGLFAAPHLAAYSASKFALNGLSQAMTAELAQYGITTTTVCPGLMRTGSPDHATFKGRNTLEYLWFTVGDSLPFTSVSVEGAVARIIDGVRRGETNIVITTQAKMAKTLNALFPETMNYALAQTTRLLPPEGGIGTEKAEGFDSHSWLAPSPLTILTSLAMKKTNEER
jgi:NAD(P)-dependent dehydrogenase (short-subunit alcohol dehydrogenase family)